MPSTVPTVIIYYESLKYTSIVQEPKMKEFDLVSNIGGTLGLFAGVSFVSFFEFGELIIETVYVLKEYKIINF